MKDQRSRTHFQRPHLKWEEGPRGVKCPRLLLCIFQTPLWQTVSLLFYAPAAWMRPTVTAIFTPWVEREAPTLIRVFPPPCWSWAICKRGICLDHKIFKLSKVHEEKNGVQHTWTWRTPSFIIPTRTCKPPAPIIVLTILLISRCAPVVTLWANELVLSTVQCSSILIVCPYFWEEIRTSSTCWARAVQLIKYDYHAQLVCKAGSVTGSKSPSPALRWSGTYYT